MNGAIIFSSHAGAGTGEARSTSMTELFQRHTVDFTADDVREVAATATKQLRELTDVVEE